MPTQPQRLLQLATELQQLEPWSQVGEGSVFLVKVPGHARPFAVTIFGDTVDVNGIEVSLEPEGFRRLAKLHDPEASDEDVHAFKPGRALSLVFLPPGQVPPEFRKVWKAAAFRPSGSRPAPQFAATDGGGGEIRPIKRSEGTILGYCAHAVVEALATARLSPPNLADGDEATLLLIVPGEDPEAFEDPELPEVEVDVVDWPDANGVLPAPYPIAREIVTAAEALPRQEGLLAISSFRSEGLEDPKISKDAHVLLLHDPDQERLVASAIEDRDESAPLESVLLQLFEAHGHLPEGLMMESARLALVAFPLCRELGIHPLLGEFGGALAHLCDDATREHGGTPRARLASTLEGLEAIGGLNMPMEFPPRLESEEDWEAAFRYTGANLLIDAEQTGALTEATARYWGGARQQARALELMSSLGAMQAFMGYALEDHVIAEKGLTVLDDYLLEARQSDELSDEELAALECRRNTVVSLFQLSEDGHTATDVLTEESFPVEIDLDEAARFGGHVMLMRRYDLGGFHAFSMAGFPATKEEQEDQMARICDALGAKPTHELLRSKGGKLGATWLKMAAHLDKALRQGCGQRP